jgi:hypothetical protein
MHKSTRVFLKLFFEGFGIAANKWINFFLINLGKLFGAY